MNTIIIPTDFSPTAINAMNYAVGMAKEINASIILFHAYQIPMTISEVPVQMVNIEEMRKDAEKHLQLLKEKIEHVTSGSLKIYKECRLGNTEDELEDYCKSIDPIAIVMGSRGSSNLDRVLFGSTTLTVIRHLSWPVIAIPPGKEYHPIKKIGFACDFKHVVETTPVDTIEKFAKLFNAELHILNVDYQDKHFTPDTPHESVLLHTMLEDLKPTYHFIEDADIGNGINRFAEENNIDLIIAIPKKHKLLESIFHQSGSKKILFASHIPIMCIHE
ncbi:universal stress protein [Ferruginibacter lapsinanis]|uniref:universal stress protein n=1 Tax=Ferruginibacter lapsinanis TaxID=563172 RepID=UPI001E657FC4|nr:universal stress protein [Ferruginibacter lapsinanis]UEG49770.1 universal stress protein [Ferruginibacter lapsinanis]